MDSVSDYANEFVRRAHSGENPSVFVTKKHLESFLKMLKREGVDLAKSCLTEISGPEMRKVVETIFFSSVAGAIVGAGIGVAMGGPPGAQVGAIIGVAVGFAAGCIAVTVVVKQRSDGLQISVAS